MLLGTGVQLVVSCTTIEVQIVFEMLLALVAGQLIIAGQLGRKVHPWSIGLLLESRDGDDLEERFLMAEAAGGVYALLWEAMTELEMEAFSCFQE